MMLLKYSLKQVIPLKGCRQLMQANANRLDAIVTVLALYACMGLNARHAVQIDDIVPTR